MYKLNFPVYISTIIFQILLVDYNNILIFIKVDLEKSYIKQLYKRGELQRVVKILRKNNFLVDRIEIK